MIVYLYEKQNKKNIKYYQAIGEIITNPSSANWLAYSPSKPIVFGVTTLQRPSSSPRANNLRSEMLIITKNLSYIFIAFGFL